MAGDKIDEVGYAAMVNGNFPESSNEYPASKYKLSVIKKGTIQINSLSVSIKKGETKKITYKYTGDGTVKCASTDKTAITCSVDKTNKKIIIIPVINFIICFI